MPRATYTVPYASLLLGWGLAFLLLLGGCTDTQTGLDPAFQGYYNLHNGIHTLGKRLSDVKQVNEQPAVYFEKGLLVEVGSQSSDFEYAMLVRQLLDSRSRVTLSGVGSEKITLSYAMLRPYTAPSYRLVPPAEFNGQPYYFSDNSGDVFLPYSPILAKRPGYRLPSYFWNYIKNGQVFPAGYLRDFGLPLTPLLRVSPGGELVLNAAAPLTPTAKVEETVTPAPLLNPVTPAAGTATAHPANLMWVQVFQRGILTYNGYEVEQANSGSDYIQAFPEVLQQ